MFKVVRVEKGNQKTTYTTWQLANYWWHFMHNIILYNTYVGSRVFSTFLKINLFYLTLLYNRHYHPVDGYMQQVTLATLENKFGSITSRNLAIHWYRCCEWGIFGVFLKPRLHQSNMCNCQATCCARNMLPVAVNMLLVACCKQHVDGNKIVASLLPRCKRGLRLRLSTVDKMCRSLS